MGGMMPNGRKGFLALTGTLWRTRSPLGGTSRDLWELLQRTTELADHGGQVADKMLSARFES